MPVIFVGLVVLLFTITSIQHVAATRLAYDTAGLAAAAMAFRYYAGHVDAYAHAHPTENGEISAAKLAMPDWYAPRPAFRNYVTGGTGFTYVRRTDITHLDALLAELTPVCAPCGVKRSSSVIGLDGRNIGPAPQAIPEGSLVRRL